MAKYQRQATNKYYGAGNAGYVTTGTSSDGLAKALTNAGYKVGKAETLRIDRKKDKAIAKIDELYANGNTFEQIQSQIIAGKHPELTGKYIDATTNYHAGRVKAHEVIKNIEANKDKYDIRNQEMTLDVFYKDYMPDTSSMDSATLLGFTTQFNKYKAKDALVDAENRAAYNTEKKITDGVGLLDDIATGDLKTELPDFIKGLQVPVPNSDGSSNSNLLHTNAETLAIVKRSILDIIANAKTEDDLDRADILLNTNLGYNKNGSAIGTIASRKSKDVIAIQDELTKKRRNLIANDRQEAEYIRKEKVKKIYAQLYEDVTETDAEGNVTTRPRTHEEKMALRDQLEAMGDVNAVATFDRANSANKYVDTDPAVIHDFVVKIYADGFTDVEEMKSEFNKLNVDPELLGKMLDHYDNSEKDDNKRLHETNLAYSSGSQIIMDIVDGSYANYANADKDKAIAMAKGNVARHIESEIYDFELDYLKQNGKKPTNKERTAFMVELEKYITDMYKSVGSKPKELKTRDTLVEEEITRDMEEVDKDIQAEENLKQVTAAIDTFESIELPKFSEDDKRFLKLEKGEKEEFRQNKLLPAVQDAVGQYNDYDDLGRMLDIMPQETYDKMTQRMSELLGVSLEDIQNAVATLATQNK